MLFCYAILPSRDCFYFFVLFFTFLRLILMGLAECTFDSRFLCSLFFRLPLKFICITEPGLLLCLRFARRESMSLPSFFPRALRSLNLVAARAAMLMTPTALPPLPFPALPFSFGFAFNFRFDAFLSFAPPLIASRSAPRPLAALGRPPDFPPPPPPFLSFLPFRIDARRLLRPEPPEITGGGGSPIAGGGGSPPMLGGGGIPTPIAGGGGIPPPGGGGTPAPGGPGTP
mmetsp:Transcript_29787/g.72608  ORF Transcript_29787/g.72608 Transcript_29787/m.72608 type:complete len:229 (-) Transcript_29787:2307-2993(-)